MKNPFKNKLIDSINVYIIYKQNHIYDNLNDI